MTNRSLFMVIVVPGCIFAHGSALAVERCVDNPESGADRPDICVDWDKTGQPTLDVNFDIQFTDLANPDVTLVTGAAWNVRSKDDAGNPANIGDIKIDADLTCRLTENELRLLDEACITEADLPEGVNRESLLLQLTEFNCPTA